MAGSQLDDIWAKSPLPGVAIGESLPEHTERVLTKMGEIQRLRPDLPERLGVPAAWAHLLSACLIHDFGKVATGFQRQVRPGNPTWGQRHEILSLAFVDWVCADDDARTWVTAAVVSHHRDVDAIQELYPSRVTVGEDPLVALVEELPLPTVAALAAWVDERREYWRSLLGDVVDSWRTPSHLSGIDESQFRQRALQTIRDGLRRYYALCRSLRNAGGELLDLGMLVRGSIIAADRLGSAHAGHLQSTGLVSGPAIAERLNLPDLRSHQVECARSEGSVIVRAPTGSGKTEAALLWAGRQAKLQHSVPRLFYVLPFQASMNAMFRRLTRAFPEDLVGLQHSRSLHALYRTLLETEETTAVAARKARLEKQLAGLNFHPVRVLSPYQILKAFYRLKGYESILCDARDGLFVLDEVHAYEPTRLAMITELIKYLTTHYHTSFCVLSATLPPIVRSRLERSLPFCTNIRATDDVFGEFRRHTLRLLDGDLLSDESLARIAAAASSHSVLVCCNTVRRAQQAYAALSARLAFSGKDVLLLHGGFNARDRLTKERVVQERADAGTPGEPVVLVATQVVEVSLDVSFGTLFSDPAPLEALLQRFGRVNRRPSTKLADVHVFTTPDDGQGVYDAAIVQSTLRVLTEHKDQPVDEGAVEDWLTAVYTAEIQESWIAAFEQAAQTFRVGCLGSLRPFQGDDALEDQFYAAFDAIDILPKVLEQEYQQLMVNNPVEADQLVVPIRNAQLGRLIRHGRVERKQPSRRWPPVIDADYDPSLGLRLTTVTEDQP